ncbi:hypothetical protein SteCoe_29052 [Stentor coeruleus]|uniref:Uncharacterized protein n=1 Tax=Stentor coeruleus TaxID=5963 RepID=A0A1R2B6T5_9CILI|nr:hypothetical protein SteCoe_29052 [Stentor coeruleus]
MAKRSKIRSKRVSVNQSKLKLVARVTPSPLSIIESKEKLIDQLKSIYSKYLNDFKSQLLFHKQGISPKLQKTSSNPKISITRDFYYHNPPSEFSYIFTLQINNFITKLLTELHDVLYTSPEIFKRQLKDTQGILQNAYKDAETLAGFLMPNQESTSDKISLGLFQDCILKNPVIARFLQESAEKQQKAEEVQRETQKTEGPVPAQGKKKCNKRKKKLEIGENMHDVDGEIEEFTRKLDMQIPGCVKRKPTVSQEWLESLKQQLKGLR